jgi:FkbM family methyltransferase
MQNTIAEILLGATEYGPSEKIINDNKAKILQTIKNPPLFLDNSQHGEVPKLIGLMISNAVEHKIIVDVGANGKRGSNSYDFLRHFSWRGLLIEANPALITRIHEEFAGLDFKLISCAVSNFCGRTNLYLGERDGTSTIQQNKSEGRNEVEVEVRRLPDILKQHFGILSVDAEGEDAKIVNDTIESGFCPDWIIMEALKPQRFTTINEMNLSSTVKKCYTLAGATFANAILKRN